MYYLDNAATTYPKPPAVRTAMCEALTKYGANPGRGGHALALAASEAVYRCRETAAVFFGADRSDHVVFTVNCTTALNMVIKGLLKNGGRALISDVEHNAVWRPLHALSPAYPVYDIFSVSMTDPAETLRNIRRTIRPDTRLIVCSHASNVWGVIQPIREIGELAQRLRIPFVVDAAQTAGVLPIDMHLDHVDFLCVAGHKGLYGPMGTGLLISNGQYPLPSFAEGGTGSRSADPLQPSDWPDHLESGTPNTPGICALHAGMRWVRARGTETLYRRELQLAQRLYTCLHGIPQAELYTPFPTVGRFVPVVSFNIRDLPAEETAKLLDESGVAVRAGLHCAPLAHRKLGTLQRGTVRLSVSAFTDAKEVDAVCKILRQTAQKTLH